MKRLPEIFSVLCIVALKLGTPAFADQTLDLQLHPGPDISPDELPKTLTLEAQRMKSMNERDLKAAPVVVKGSLDQAFSFDLNPGTWRFHLRTEGAWLKALQLTWPNSELPEDPLFVYPAGSLLGKLSDPELQDGLYVRFEPVDEEDKETLKGWAPCPIEEQAFHCWVPFGRYDLRFWVDGRAEAYAWDIPISSEKVAAAGKLRLPPGGSISGWIESESQRVDLAKAVIKIQPEAGYPSRSPEVGRRFAKKALEIHPDERGFFQATNLEEGVYFMTTSLEPFAPATASVRVLENQVTNLGKSAFVLRTPARLRIDVQPPFPPGIDSNRRWGAEIVQVDRSGRTLKELDSGLFDLSGKWIAEDLPYGRLALKLQGPDQDTWHVELFEMEVAEQNLFIDLPLTQVRGTVTLGDEPVEGELLFGLGFNDRILLESDENGEFQGYLPHSGPWKVVVQSTDRKIQKTRQGILAEERPGKSWSSMDIHLAATVLRGQAIDAEGKPVPRAQIIASTVEEEPEGWEAVTSQRTDELGDFEIFGLAPGRVLVSADAFVDGRRHFTREVVEVRVTEGDLSAEPVEVVLEPARRFAGRILHQGIPVTGAGLNVVMAENAAAPTPRLVTDEAGRFHLDVPAAVEHLLINVEAPGFAYSMRRVSARQPANLEIERAGGTLELHMPPDLFSYGTEIAGLFHDGGFLPALLLQNWSRRRGAEPWTQSRARIPEMEPGEYRLCRMPRLGLLEILATGIAPGPCVAGILQPNDELRLDLRIDS